MMRSILAAALFVALTAGVAVADGSPGVLPSFPVGVTVYVTASATTTDVTASWTTTKTAKNAGQAATALAAAKAAAGAEATVVDMGSPESMMMGMEMAGSGETVRITLGAADVAAVRAKLKSAGFVNGNTSYIARDLDALRGSALASATKSARVQAEAAAAADGRHIGRLLNVSPSPMAMLQDVTSMLSNVPQAAALFGGAGRGSATSFVSGYYTFELLP